ncbi:MAG TPA: EamA family transporter [Clostridia bacterium]|nr:EamA family transporter [Clostridia bacterium]
MFKLHYVKLFFVPILWGGALVAGRVVAPNLPPFTTAFLRFLAVSLFLLPFLYAREGGFPRPSRKSALLLVLLSFTGVMMFNFFLFSGLRTVTAVRSAVFIAFTPAVVALASALFFREKINLLMGLGIVSAFIGAVITITNGDIQVLLSRAVSTGDLFLLGCVVMWTIYSITAKFVMNEIAPFTLLTYGSLIGSLLMIPFVLWEGAIFSLHTQPPETWFGLLYLSIGAAGIAYLWYYEGIKAVGAPRAAIFLNLEPVAAMVLGIVILNEQITLPVLIGALLVIFGLLLTNYPAKKPKKVSPQPDISV